MLFDYARPFAYRTKGHAGATISLSRAFAESRAGPLEAQGVLDPSDETRLLAEFMHAMVRRLPGLSGRSVPSLILISQQMIGLALGEAGRTLPAPPTLRGRPPGTLDPVRMAEDLGMSRTKLYRAFANDGGVVAFDRTRRLHRLHAALLEAPRDVSPSRLGEDHGFLDVSALARQFRRQFGYSMSALRSHLELQPRMEPDMEPDMEPVASFRQAFEGLSRLAR